MKDEPGWWGRPKRFKQGGPPLGWPTAGSSDDTRIMKSTIAVGCDITVSTAAKESISFILFLFREDRYRNPRRNR
jgi:hypothetical protein